jgi:exo-beta-1,3-glucanase (GH17 family)
MNDNYILTLKQFIAVVTTSIVLYACGECGDADSDSYILHGLNFSPYIQQQDPNEQVVIDEQQIRERLGIIAQDTKWIRTFGVSGGLENIPQIAHELGLKVAVGAWLDSDTATNEQEINTLISLARSGFVDIAIVGNEVLLRNDLSAGELIDYINRVQNELQGLGIPVTTVDRFRELGAHREVLDVVSLVMVNYYPFWEGISIKDAIPTLHAWHLRLQSLAGDKKIIVSETGWPSDGGSISEAVPNLQNAAKYFLTFVSWARAEDVKYFYFEALDEPWKADYEGPAGDSVGAHWGIRNEDGSLKAGMNAVFNNNTVADNWTPQLIDGPGTPTITLTYVPPIGSFDNLQGHVSHVYSTSYRIAVYIRVAGQWWVKPYFNAPLTTIAPNGNWTTDITTGGSDTTADSIAAFLVPLDYDPPLLGGSSTIPSSLYTDSVANIQVYR